MSKILNVIFAVLCVVNVITAKAEEAYYFPNELDAMEILRGFLIDTQRPNHFFSELSNSILLDSHVLLFRAEVDDRPLVVESCVIGSEIMRNGNREWLITAFFRHPYGPREGHTKWMMRSVRGVHSEFSIQHLTEAPTNARINAYLEWSRWNKSTDSGFKDITYLYFPDSWHKLVKTAPLHIYDAQSWPPNK
jgi:hypothetical protein